MLGSLAILGIPPFGVFASEFMILTVTMHQQPWATPFLLAALGVAFAAIFRQSPANGIRHRDRAAPAASAGVDTRVRCTLRSCCCSVCIFHRTCRLVSPSRAAYWIGLRRED